MTAHPAVSPLAPLARIDGPEKVSGAARYAAEFAPDGICHGVMHRAGSPTC